MVKVWVEGEGKERRKWGERGITGYGEREVECVEREHRENCKEKDPLVLFTVRGVLGPSSAGSLAESMNTAF